MGLLDRHDRVRIAPSPFSADKLTLADGHNEGIHAVIREGSLEQWAECLLVVYGVVGNKDASGDHAGNHGLVARRIDLLLGIQEAERQVRVVREVLQGVAMNEVYNIENVRQFERSSSHPGLCLQDLKRCDSATNEAACQGQPQSGVAGTGAYLDVSSRRSDRSQQRDELPGLRGDLPKPIKSGSAIGAINGVSPLKLPHPVKKTLWYVAKH